MENLPKRLKEVEARFEIRMEEIVLSSQKKKNQEGTRLKMWLINRAPVFRHLAPTRNCIIF